MIELAVNKTLKTRQIDYDSFTAGQVHQVFRIR